MPTVSVPTDDALDYLRARVDDDVEIVVWDGAADPPAEAGRIELFVGRYNTPPPERAVFEALPSLRVIQLLSAGVEPWLPVVPDGVTLCNGRGIHGASTAELAVGGLLAVLRRIPHFAQAQRRHEWDREFTRGLDGRRVVVVGAGDIGGRVATAVGAFGADVAVVARTARDGVHALAELPALLPETDVVVLAVPQTPDTAGLVDAPFLAALPDDAVLVNVSRGGLVDTSALLGELTARRLHAFLDVTDPEPLPADHPLWDAPNLLLTPHVGGGTTGWDKRAYRLVAQQVERLAAGEDLANVVRDGY